MLGRLIMVNARIISASVEFHPRKLATPLTIGESRIETVVEARARVRVVASGLDGGGDERFECEATGVGAVYLSHLWAWPRQRAFEDTREQRMIDLCQRLAADLPAIVGDDAAHPLELGARLHARVGELNKAACVRVRGGISDELDAELRSMPPLARLICLSPFDAALHDAAGLALGRSAFSF
ncbi:MAG TPA: hypothetical protein PLV92_15675, partial [Pirellulaceae bacterium]|nr:hypothetical protein [Pirellulaceae bacterium]